VKRTVLVVLFLLLLPIGSAAYAIQDCTFGYCNPTPSGGCAFLSYYWACINNTALCYDSGSQTWGYDCWAVDSCQESYCYIQGTGSKTTPKDGNASHANQQK
jgi:hypothetical protein